MRTTITRLETRPTWGRTTGSASYYGTFDQNGNVWEWNESTYYSSSRGLRGGAFDSNDNYLQASSDVDHNPTNDGRLGFRVSEVPEPSSVIALLGGLAGLLGIMRRGA